MIEPLKYRVLIKPIELEVVDEAFAAAKRAGIQILEDARTKEINAVDRGTVVAIGPEAEVGVEVGDDIYYAKYAGKKIVDPHTKEEFLALNDEDLVARIKSETK